MHFSGDMADILAEMFGGGQRRGFSSAFGGGGGGGGGGFFGQMFGAEEEQQSRGDPFGFGGGGDSSFGGGFGGDGRDGRGSSAAAAVFDVEVSLEALYVGATKVVTVPHRIRVAGAPFTYTYKHSYTVRLKPS